MKNIILYAITIGAGASLFLTIPSLIISAAHFSTEKVIPYAIVSLIAIGWLSMFAEANNG